MGVVRQRSPENAVIMENRIFVLIVATLVVLIALAAWQFYSLAWGDIISSANMSGPNVAAVLEGSDHIFP